MYLSRDWRPMPHSGKPMWEMRPGTVLGARETWQSKSKHHYLEDKPVPTWFFIPRFLTWKIKCLCPDHAAGSSETVSCLHKSCYVAISGCGLEGRWSPAKEHCRAPEGWRFLTLCGRDSNVQEVLEVLGISVCTSWLVPMRPDPHGHHWAMDKLPAWVAGGYGVRGAFCSLGSVLTIRCFQAFPTSPGSSCLGV